MCIRDRALREESSQDSQVLALCHDILHAIGHVAFDKYGSFKEAVPYQEDFCNSGYIHGLLESYLSTSEDPLVGLRDQCDDYGQGKREFDLLQCYHGIGHGLMYVTGGDLDHSLRLCRENLPEEARPSCQNGVYMEIFNREVLAKEKSFVNPDDPFLTCSSREEAKGDCYFYIPTYLSQTLSVDFIDIFHECAKAEDGYVDDCIAGVGAEVVKRNMSALDEVFALCAQAGTLLAQQVCVSGGVNMYMSQEASTASGERLCAQAPRAYQDSCFKTVKSKTSFFGSDTELP
jgi:hypothetical protein